MFSAIFEVFSHPYMDLFATRTNTGFLCMFIWFWILWHGSKMLFSILGVFSVLTRFPPSFSKTGLVIGDAFYKSLLHHDSSSLASEGVVQIYWLLWWENLLCSLCCGVFGLAACWEVSHRFGDAATSCLEVVKRFVYKAGFLKEIVEVIVSDLRRSTACPYQKSDLAFSIGVMLWKEYFSMQGHFLQIADLFLSLWRVLKLSVSVAEGLSSFP